jgi:hypothetical protein
MHRVTIQQALAVFDSLLTGCSWAWEGGRPFGSYADLESFCSILVRASQSPSRLSAQARRRRDPSSLPNSGNELYLLIMHQFGDGRGLSPLVSGLFALRDNLPHPDMNYGSNTSRINRYTRRSFSSLHASNAASILFRRDLASDSSPSRSTKSLTGTFSALANAMIVSKVGLLRPFSKALKYFASPRVRSATCSCVSPAASRIDFNFRPNAFAYFTTVSRQRR